MDLKIILEQHGLWLSGNDGQRAYLQGAYLRGAYLQGAYLQGADLRGAYLRGADLRGADLRGADLRGADLDFSCWPLWCGSLGVKVDAQIVNQLIYHLCSVDCADEDFQAIRPLLLRLANKFHRTESGECQKLS